MDILVIVGVIAAIVGIVVGIVQVLDYLQKRRESRPESPREIEAKPADHASPDPYNIAAIRNLLRDAFTADEFRRFCRDRPLFEPLLSRFGPGANLEDMIDVAIEYCQKRSVLSELLTQVKAVNPRQWERHRDLVHHDDLIESRIPENLDPRSEFFVGREAEKAEVHEALRRSRLVCIEGIGGIGKTALALEVAHECREASVASDGVADVATFAGFLWASAKDRDLALDDILDVVARTLGYVGIAQKPPDEKRVAICDLLRTKSCLLVIDNYETITDEKVHDLLGKLPEPSKALITSRGRDWAEAEVVSLTDLSRSEALELMRTVGRRLKLSAIERAQEQDLLPLRQVTQGVPLAIKWAIGQIKQRGQTLDTVVLALKEAKGSIFDNIFGHSWDLMLPDAKSVLMVMPLFATSASREGIEAASGIHHSALDEALGQLVEMSLVDVSNALKLARQRYSIHPLTRAFATAKLQQKPETHYAALKQLAEFMQTFTAEHGGFWHHPGFVQLEVDIQNILATVLSCKSRGFLNRAVTILQNALGFMLIEGYWDNVITLRQTTSAQIAEEEDLAAKFTLDEFVIMQSEAIRGQKYRLEEVEMLQRACVLVNSAYRSQKRAAGYSYVYHPVAVSLIVAKILREMDLEVTGETIVVALLHDSYEMSEDVEGVKDAFGEEVGKRISQIPKMMRRFEEEEKQASLGVQIDIGNLDWTGESFHPYAVLIKLADSLHNLLTIGALAPEKQERFANRTKFLYIPLAKSAGYPRLAEQLDEALHRVIYGNQT